MLFVCLAGCKNALNNEDEIAAIPMDLKVKRFDLAFGAASELNLAAVKKEFPYLFPEQYADSVWLIKMKDSLQMELRGQVDSTFANFTPITTELTSLFQHISFYYPKFTIPTVVTVTSDVDYRNRVIFADTLLLIGLDNYLGATHKYYEGIPKYIAQGLDKKYVSTDVASALVKKMNPRPIERSFLAHMIYYGKEAYAKEQLLPKQSSATINGYTDEQFAWAVANESEIWRYIIANEMLYDTDLALQQRFLEPAPFTKFQLELDAESPGRLGRFIGWQIVRAFAKETELSLPQVLAVPAEEILKKSTYKPQK